MALAFHTMQCLGDMMKKIIILISIIVLMSSAVGHAETLYVIAQKGAFVSQKNKNDIADLYLLKLKINSTGLKIIPINLPINHPLRSKFSQSIFNRSPEALSEYWDRMSFRGIRPPVVQRSEQAVILFVSRVKGAIGYVSQKPLRTSNVEILSEISL